MLKVDKVHLFSPNYIYFEEEGIKIIVEIVW